MSAKGICRSINWPDGCLTSQTPQDEGDSCARAARGVYFGGVAFSPNCFLRDDLLGGFPRASASLRQQNIFVRFVMLHKPKQVHKTFDTQNSLGLTNGPCVLRCDLLGGFPRASQPLLDSNLSLSAVSYYTSLCKGIRLLHPNFTRSDKRALRIARWPFWGQFLGASASLWQQSIFNLYLLCLITSTSMHIQRQPTKYWWHRVKAVHPWSERDFSQSLTAKNF